MRTSPRCRALSMSRATRKQDFPSWDAIWTLVISRSKNIRATWLASAISPVSSVGDTGGVIVEPLMAPTPDDQPLRRLRSLLTSGRASDLGSPRQHERFAAILWRAHVSGKR